MYTRSRLRATAGLFTDARSSWSCKYIQFVRIELALAATTVIDDSARHAAVFKSSIELNRYIAVVTVFRGYCLHRGEL